jgi:hypothetical protein
VVPWELPPVDQVQWWQDSLPESERLARLAQAERSAQARGDTELLAALAAWRLAQQLKA